MTEVILRKIPSDWLVVEDGERLADSFEVGMLLDVSTKGTKCRVYSPEDAFVPFDCLEFVSGDFDKRFLKSEK